MAAENQRDDRTGLRFRQWTVLRREEPLSGCRVRVSRPRPSQKNLERLRGKPNA